LKKKKKKKDGQNSWSKHAAVYAAYNAINLHICIGYALVGFISHNESSVYDHESFKAGIVL
jgi:hypothetical protein